MESKTNAEWREKHCAEFFDEMRHLVSMELPAIELLQRFSEAFREFTYGWVIQVMPGKEQFAAAFADYTVLAFKQSTTLDQAEQFFIGLAQEWDGKPYTSAV